MPARCGPRSRQCSHMRSSSPFRGHDRVRAVYRCGRALRRCWRWGPRSPGVSGRAATPAGPTVGGQLTRLLSSERQALEPVLSGDGSMLAYVAEDQNEVFDIFVSRVAGGDRVRITNDAARESHPRFSPDGNQVVFARRRPGERDPEICVVPSFGGQVSVVVANAGQPVWSPDAARLAFIRPATASAPSVLATARLDGSDERTLAQADGVYPAIRNPAWSARWDLDRLRAQHRRHRGRALVGAGIRWTATTNLERSADGVRRRADVLRRWAGDHSLVESRRRHQHLVDAGRRK